jgi:hypothetical protein
MEFSGMPIENMDIGFPSLIDNSVFNDIQPNFNEVVAPAPLAPAAPLAAVAPAPVLNLAPVAPLSAPAVAPAAVPAAAPLATPSSVAASSSQLDTYNIYGFSLPTSTVYFAIFLAVIAAVMFYFS